MFAFSDQEAAKYLRRAEDIRQASTGRKRTEVRAIMAREIGIAPGTIENLRRGRFASLKTAVRDAIHAYMVRQVEAEIKRGEDELRVFLAVNGDPSTNEVGALQTAIASARNALADRRAVR